MNDRRHQDDSRPKQNAATDICEICGGYGALEIGDRHLCDRCRAESGSCCPEFGREKDSTTNERQ